MRKIIYLTLLVSLEFFVLACSNHDTSAPIIPSETPMSSFVASKTMSIYKYAASYNGAALGYEFKVKANAYVTGLGCASPAIGTYNLTLFQVDSVNKSGKLLTSIPITIGASDTANFKFSYATLATKISITKGVYYRVAVNGDFTAYNYMTFPQGSSLTLPLPLATDAKFVFTKGVSGYANQYPDNMFNNYLFTSDVMLQFP